MTYYIDDETDGSNEALFRSMLSLLQLCRSAAARVKVEDETSHREMLDGLAIAEINIRRLMADPQDTAEAS